jgi:hypothetical protein
MNDLVRHYREYYREQTPAAFDNLFRCMLDYDFSSYRDDMRRVSAMWREAKCVGESKTLFSGGSSTGIRRSYEFGPNFPQARLLVEGFLRMSHKKTLLLAHSTDINTPSFKHRPNPPQYDFDLIGNWQRLDHLDFLFDSVERLNELFGSINICALPAVWLGLTCDPEFVTRAERKAIGINALVNTDDTKCFRRIKCRTRDQMIDWSSGVNFYTCDAGRYHFLPTFFCSDRSSFSLINLKKSSKDQNDLLTIRHEDVTCPCGRPGVFLDFVPHKDNFPFCGGRFFEPERILENIPDYTSRLQIYQDGERQVKIFYSSNKAVDLSILIRHLKNLGIEKINILASKYFLVGVKKPFLWRKKSPEVLSRG